MGDNSRYISSNTNVGRMLIEDITDLSSREREFNNNRQLLPAIRNVTPNNSSLANLNQFPIQPLNFNSSNSFDSNNTQLRIKQLESRLQLSDVNNKSMLEEILKLQNEMAYSLKRSMDSLNEERNARNMLENNYRLQTESFIQLNARLKRTEDFLQEDRGAMQSLILYTKNLEQSTINTQKDLFVRRDFQAQRLEELRIQIDDIQRSKENLERSAFSLIEEIKNLKSKVDFESMSFSSTSADLRNKTRRLEEENRQNFDQMKKQQDIIHSSENNLFSIKSHLENKINDVRDLVNDVRFKVESEKEEKKNIEQQISNRYGDVISIINEEKQKYNECIRNIDSLKRQINQNFESEKIKVNSLVNETKDLISVSSNDKIDKLKEEMANKLRDLEKKINDELDNKSKFVKNVKDTTETKMDAIKRYVDDEFKITREDIKDSHVKTMDSVKILNDGLNLIEKQNEERMKKFEKVISAEIKLRKTTEQGFNEKIDNHNEKFTYAIQSFQSTVGNLSNTISEQKEQFVNQTEFEALKRKQEALQDAKNQNDLQLSSIKSSLSTHEAIYQQQQDKLKELSETTYKLDSIQIPSINTRLGELATDEELKALKTSMDQQLREEIEQVSREFDANKIKLKQELEQSIKQVKDENESKDRAFEAKSAKTEGQMNKRLDEFNEQIGTWKKNVNSALDKVKLENEATNRKILAVEEKVNKVEREQRSESKLRSDSNTKNDSSPRDSKQDL